MNLAAQGVVPRSHQKPIANKRCGVYGAGTVEQANPTNQKYSRGGAMPMAW